MYVTHELIYIAHDRLMLLANIFVSIYHKQDVFNLLKVIMQPIMHLVTNQSAIKNAVISVI